MMPKFRSRPSDGTARDGEWKCDPVNKNWQRYHNGLDFTPYVRIGERTMWDLARSGRVPEGDEYADVESLILSDSGAWLEVTRQTIHMKWSRSHPGVDALVTIDLDALARFEVNHARTPENLELRITGYNSPRYSEGNIHPVQSGMISMSMVFWRQHESALRDLRDLLERMCERPLTDAPGRSEESQPEPTSQQRDRQPGLREKESRSAESTEEWAAHPHRAGAPMTSAEPGEHDSRHSEAANPSREDPDVGRRVRPVLPTLTVSVETAPDTDEWLSFATTSIDVLIGADGADHRDGARDDRYDSAPVPPVADRGGGHA